MSNAIVEVKDGKEVFPRIKNLLAQLKDGKYLIEPKKLNRRSNEQNRYYFGLIIPMIQKGLNDLGHELSKQETHEFLKAKFNYLEIVNEATGEMILVPKSTAALNKGEFILYIEKIQRFASEFLNIIIPDPGQQVELWQ